MSNSTLTAALAAHSCFTVAQWQELEHQALIFKYLKAGLFVPPYLLLPIRKSFGLFSPPLFHTPTSTLNYYPYYGKKVDNEPGRCRRTDGKKWRCSKDAHPDSKYCERHMNRSRNRSRKPVESKTAPQLSISTVASSHVATGSSGLAVTFPNLSLPSRGNPEAPFYGSNMMRWQTESLPYGVALNSKECRSLDESKSGADKQTFVPEALKSARNLGMNNITNDTWCLASQMPSNPLQEPRTGDLLLNRSSQLQALHDFEPLSIGGAMSKQQQQQHYTFGKEFASAGLMKQEYEDYQTLQPLFDEWPKCKDLDSFSDENTSKIQLSMGISMAPNSAAKSFLSQDDVCRENR